MVHSSEAHPDNPDKPEAEEGGSRKRKRRRGDKFNWSYLLDRTREQQVESEEPRKEASFSKRVRQALRRVFGQIAPLTPVANKEATEPQASPDSVVAAQVPTPEATTPPAADNLKSQETAESSPHEAVNEEDTAKEEDTAENEQGAKAANPSKRRKPKEAAGSSEPKEKAELAANENEDVVELNNAPNSVDTAPAVQNRQPGPPPIDIPAMERVVYERQATEPEPVIARDRGARSLAVLVGVAETIGRRRADRRLERKSNKETASLKQETKQDLGRRAKLEQAAAKSKEAMEQLRNRQEALEARPAAQPNHRNYNNNAERKVKASAPEGPPPLSFARKSPEQPAASTPEQKPAMRTIEQRTEHKEPAPDKPLKPKEALKKPEAVLREVAAAAEKNVALEGLYERRHEVKDDAVKLAAAPAAAGGASSIPAPQDTSAAASSGQAPASSRAVQLLQEAAQHRQAAQSGFWAALIILVFLMVASMIV